MRHQRRLMILADKLMPLLIGTAVLLASAAPTRGDQPAEAGGRDGSAKPVRALMVTGGCCHDYQNQKEIISRGLTERVGPIEWTIVQYGDQRDIQPEVYQSAEWINGFDIVIHNECFGAVDDAKFLQGIVEAHRTERVPAIMIHCSLHSYRAAPNADAWRELIGVTSRRHERQNRSLDVVATTAGASHAVLAKVPSLQPGKSWKTPNGELYLIEKVWPGATVLATAHSSETGKDEAVVWANEIDGVRVFGTSLGHHNETMRDETWQQIVAEGWRWALAKP